jgi:hypothetical protein
MKRVLNFSSTTWREKIIYKVWEDNIRWFKYDRDKLWLVYTQIVPVIFEPPCTKVDLYDDLYDENKGTVVPVYEMKAYWVGGTAPLILNTGTRWR